MLNEKQTLFSGTFVVIKANVLWLYAEEGVDLVIKGTSGEQIQDFHDKTSKNIKSPRCKFLSLCIVLQH